LPNLNSTEKLVVTVLTAIISQVVAFVPSFSPVASTVIGLLPTIVVAAYFVIHEIEHGTNVAAALASPAKAARAK
jgi:hypothetical protein